MLDDPEYKPGGGGSGAVGGSFGYHPIITVPPKKSNAGEIFDVTVSAIQGPGSANTGQPFIYPGNKYFSTFLATAFDKLPSSYSA